MKYRYVYVVHISARLKAIYFFGFATLGLRFRRKTSFRRENIIMTAGFTFSPTDYSGMTIESFVPEQYCRSRYNISFLKSAYIVLKRKSTNVNASGMQ